MVDYGPNSLLRDMLIHTVYEQKLVSPGYAPEAYFKYDPEHDFLKISVYVAKKTPIVFYVSRFSTESEERIMYAFKRAISNFISSKLVRDSQPFEKKIELIKRYFGEKENKEEKTMNKSMQEIEFEQYSACKEAELKVRTQEIQHEIDTQIEQKRLECLEDQKRQEQAKIAANYWYFYRGLIDSGFTEEQAMQILLAKERSRD